MKRFFKELGAFIVRTIAFLLLYYFAGLFVGAWFEGTFSNLANLWIPLLLLSVYLPLTLALFWGVGWICARFSKDGWSVWLDGAFALVVAAWGIVTTLTTDIAKLMGGFLWELTTGWATPVYNLAHMLTGSDINYYKYVFSLFWVVLAAAIFCGLRFRYVVKEKRRKTCICTAAALAALAISINVPTMINTITPHIFNRATYPTVMGATAALPLMQEMAQELKGLDAIEAKKLTAVGTHNAYEALIYDKADVIFAAEPSDEEIALAKENGVTLKLTSVGMDAFVFIVNTQNPIDGLTTQQIRGIYSGQITNWKEIDGVTDREIVAYQRPKNSGSQTLMENVVMKGLSITEAPTERVPGGMGGMMDAVADYQNSAAAIGYNIYYYASQMERRESVKFLSVDGVPCNKDTIYTGEYPFAGELYAITRDGDESKETQKLLEYFVSNKGASLVERGGFVSIYSDKSVIKSRVIGYPEGEFGVPALIKYIKDELGGSVVEFGYDIMSENNQLAKDSVEADFINGKADTLHIYATDAFDYDPYAVNKPIQLTFEINGATAVYQNAWNDGVHCYIWARTRNDKYMNIAVQSSGTGAGDHHTTIYRYDGTEIFKFVEFAHYVKELYLGNDGNVYYVRVSDLPTGIMFLDVVKLDMETGATEIIKTGF